MWETFTIRPGLSDSNDNSNADTTTKSSNDSGNVLRSSEPIRGTLLTKHPKFDVGEGTYFDISKYEFTTEEDLKRYDELGRPLGDDLPK